MPSNSFTIATTSLARNSVTRDYVPIH
jgi:hypothetical protein